MASQSDVPASHAVKWSLVVKRGFGVLLLAYPGVSHKIFMMYRCVWVDGVAYLEADVTLECYTSQWAMYAGYAGVMGCVYVVGLPVAVFGILWRERGSLFGPHSDVTRDKWGFLYEVYTPSGWFWEVEEMLRRLLLVSVVVFVDSGSVSREVVAVCVCLVAQVLHGVFKPWGPGSVAYVLQHGALGVTSVVFWCGLMLKCGAVRSGSGWDAVLWGMVGVGCGIVLVCWLAVISYALVRAVRVKALAKSGVHVETWSANPIAAQHIVKSKLNRKKVVS
jgi:hypothetical protein